MECSLTVIRAGVAGRECECLRFHTISIKHKYFAGINFVVVIFVDVNNPNGCSIINLILFQSKAPNYTCPKFNNLL